MRKNIICAIIICIVLSISLGCIAIRNFSQGNERIAYIYSEGTLVKQIDLNAVTEPYSFTVINSKGSSNKIEVRRGEIAVTYATCKDGVCEKTGFISSSAFPIVCIPNDLVIKISTCDTADDVPDAVAQ